MPTETILDHQLLFKRLLQELVDTKKASKPDRQLRYCGDQTVLLSTWETAAKNNFTRSERCSEVLNSTVAYLMV